MAERPDHYPGMDLRQQLLFEAQQQTDLLDRIADLIEALKEPAEVVVIEQEVVAIKPEEAEAVEPAMNEPEVIQPEPAAVTTPRRNLFSRLFG